MRSKYYSDQPRIFNKGIQKYFYVTKYLLYHAETKVPNKKLSIHVYAFLRSQP